MKRILILLAVLFLVTSTYGQEIRKEVENGIFVTFPNVTEYKVTTEASAYSSKTENCFYMVLIQRNAIPNYSEFTKAEKNWTEAQKKQVRDKLLDSAVKGHLDYVGKTGKVTEIKKGNFYGRKVEYSAVNPATGVKGKRYLVMLSVRDKMISFECMLLKDNNNAILEKDKFINSISTSENNTITNKSNTTSTTQNTNSSNGGSIELEQTSNNQMNNFQDNQIQGLADRQIDIDPRRGLGNTNEATYGSTNPDIMRLDPDMTNVPLEGHEDINRILYYRQPNSEKLFNTTLLIRIFIVGAVILIPLAISIKSVKKKGKFDFYIYKKNVN